MHFKGENDTIELGSHIATWTAFKLQFLVAVGLYIHAMRVTSDLLGSQYAL